MAAKPKQRIRWGILTVAFALATVVFLLAAYVIIGPQIYTEDTQAINTAVALNQTATAESNATASPGLGTPVPTIPPLNPPSAPTHWYSAIWPPSATTFTDVLAIMGGISSIGTLISFIGLAGRGAQSLAKRIRRTPV